MTDAPGPERPPAERGAGPERLPVERKVTEPERLPAERELVVAAFNDAINRRDLAALGRLMTADHRFIDSARNVVAGKSACLLAWRQFFDAFPDYRNAFDDVRGGEGVVHVSGRSDCAEPLLAGPARWRVVIDGHSVVEWRVFDAADGG